MVKEDTAFSSFYPPPPPTTSRLVRPRRSLVYGSYYEASAVLIACHYQIKFMNINTVTSIVKKINAGIKVIAGIAQHLLSPQTTSLPIQKYGPQLTACY
ncbi:hypothetical protein DSUL_20040 [Desulfovibrionales bacterium]